MYFNWRHREYPFNFDLPHPTPTPTGAKTLNINTFIQLTSSITQFDETQNHLWAPLRRACICAILCWVSLSWMPLCCLSHARLIVRSYNFSIPLSNLSSNVNPKWMTETETSHSDVANFFSSRHLDYKTFRGRNFTSRRIVAARG